MLLKYFHFSVHSYHIHMHVRLLVFYDLVFFFFEQRRVYCLGQGGRIVNSYSEEFRSLVVFREDDFWVFFCFCFGINRFWLHWIFVALRGLSLVAESRDYSSLQDKGFSLWWLLLLWDTGSRHEWLWILSFLFNILGSSHRMH